MSNLHDNLKIYTFVNGNLIESNYPITFDGQTSLIDAVNNITDLNAIVSLTFKENEFKENDDRFIYIKQPQNMGASAARNTGLENVTTEYTTFLDADDYWENTTLEEMVFAAKKYNADVVQCRFIYDFPGGKKISPSPAFKKDIFLKGKGLKKVYMKMLTGINMNHVCMKIIKKVITKC